MTRGRTVLATLAMLLAACSDDGRGSPPAEPTGTDATTTPTDSASTDATVIDTSFTRDGTTVAYRLALDGALCFSAEIDSTDPTLDATFADTVDECLEDLVPLRDPITATVGALDGNRQFGYVWGRVTNEATRLEFRFADGSTVDVDPVATDLGLRVFAAVLDTRGLAEVETLAAVGPAGTVLGSVSVRDFLRAGPTYPTVAPSTVPPPTYPTS